MKKNKMVPVLLAGGIGSRLWPLSREHYPKQLLDLLGSDSLLQASLRRILKAKDIEQLVVICNEEHRFEVLTQIEELNPHCPFTIILEPMGRNTAPAATLAAFLLKENVNMLFMPADHVLKPEDEFLQQVNYANEFASDGKLITFGIKPTYPETGYGYIQTSTEVAKNVYEIAQFREKPDRQTAEMFIEEGNYFWNSGMFLFSRDALLGEVFQYAPMTYSTVKQAADTFTFDNHFARVAADKFIAAPDLSIDYAIMEYTKNALMLPLETQWSDIGSWQSLYEYENHDVDNNVSIGDVVSIDNSDCYLRSDSRLMAAIGLKNIIAVQTADCVLIANTTESQRVKEVVKKLKKDGRREALQHLMQYHPWGSSTIVNNEEDFIVRRTDILPGKATSLHDHQGSAESWLVVKGTATVLIENQTHEYPAGSSFAIGMRQKHKIFNHGDDLLQMIEVRTGNNLSLKDINRYD